MQKQQWEIARLRRIIKGALEQLDGIEGFRCHTRTSPCAATRISAARVLLDQAVADTCRHCAGLGSTQYAGLENNYEARCQHCNGSGRVRDSANNAYTRDGV